MAYYIGLMTGSSVDAIDAVLVSFDQQKPTIHHSLSIKYPDKLRAAIVAMQHGHHCSAEEICSTDARLGQYFAEAAESLINQSGVGRQRIRAIGSHGQTICHLPEHTPKATLQIGSAAYIAELTKIDTVSDFRRRDMAAGGQGAPLAPALHQAFLQSDQENRCILNLGGIANLTVLPNDQKMSVIGFDSGPANALIDLWIEKHTKARFDKDGAIAAQGTVDRDLLSNCLEDPYFSRPPPKSTGRDYFSEDWLMRRVEQPLSLEDMLATLTELTALSIVDAIQKYAYATKTILVCGGGVKNRQLMMRLALNLPNTNIRSTASEGMPPLWVEPILIAWLAARTIDGQTGNLPSVTGARDKRICGAIYPAMPS